MIFKKYNLQFAEYVISILKKVLFKEIKMFWSKNNLGSEKNLIWSKTDCIGNRKKKRFGQFICLKERVSSGKFLFLDKILS